MYVVNGTFRNIREQVLISKRNRYWMGTGMYVVNGTCNLAGVRACQPRISMLAQSGPIKLTVLPLYHSLDRKTKPTSTMKANNNSSNSRPTPPSPPEGNDAFVLSYNTILLGSSYRQAGGSSSPPPLPFLQSGPGKGAITRKHLLATLDEALAIISDDSDSLDSISNANNSQ
jgi:hypothetical protein